MVDLESVKQSSDLLGIIERDTPLKKVATTGGGEYAGACPFPGCQCDKDGFRVQVNHKGQGPRWYCRGCGEGRWHSVIDYVARRDNLDPKNHDDLQEICKRALGGADIPATRERKAAPEQPAYAPPSAEWQELAGRAISDCEARLWQPEGARALEYLHNRGLKDRTIKRFGLGYSPEGHKVKGKFWLDRGITIPCVVRNTIWYVKVRLPAKLGELKYRCMTGSKPAAIFNGDDLRGSDIALFCEGEFDTMIAWQEINDIIPAATLGSATNRPDLATWGIYFLPIQNVLLAYDLDEAGEKGAAELGSLLGDRQRLALLPDGQWKDITDFYLAGGNLAGWIGGYMDFYTDDIVSEKCHSHK